MSVSMTGFGRGEYRDENYHFTVECKSINHRYLDINIRVPRKIAFFEERIRSQAKQYLKRGRVDIFVGMELTGESESELKLDLKLAKGYHEVLKKIAGEIDVKNDITISSIARFPEVVKLLEKEEDEELIWKSLAPALEEAFRTVRDMRKVEGDKISADIIMRCALMEEYLSEVEKLSDTVVVEYKDKLTGRIKDLLGAGAAIDEARIAQEAAMFADRCSITEEIVRFRSHIIQLGATLKEDDSVGRKIDFLIQEMNREANTIGSKSSNLRITQLIVDIKSELEKIREQVQNIE
ncbi:MAG: YicC family protein [Peptoclostridium sp.]|uniref:YicC/YloC family endoribonuclease n=1 Tax=Peptoclostridium sp. TaxID=1904860 RepID=UPI00139B148B|nr:YicC/YloC family endoribonuclease [Peptoclostridium sp.]MZQ76299.1 YicC family protein [Peptoclostridium sp.]